MGASRMSRADTGSLPVDSRDGPPGLPMPVFARAADESDSVLRVLVEAIANRGFRAASGSSAGRATFCP